MGMSFIAPEHIFLALLAASDGEARTLFAALRLDSEACRAQALARLKGESEGERPTRQKVAVSVFVLWEGWVGGWVGRS